MIAVVVVLGAGALVFAKHLQFSKLARAAAAQLEAGSKIASTPRGPLEYAVRGKGPAVLYSHGTPGAYDQGLAFAKMLGNPPFQFITPSRPGYLRTSLKTGESPEYQADAFAALLDTLSVKRAVMIGNSGGGPAALQFALRHAPRCAGLVLISAITTRSKTTPRDRVQQILHELVFPSNFPGWLISSLTFGAPQWLYRRVIGRKDPERAAAVEKLPQTLLPRNLRAAGLANDTSQFARLDPYRFSKITCPTLVVHGTADAHVPFSHAKLAAHEIPRAALLPVEEAGHNVFLGQGSERTIERILGFLSRCSSAL